MRKGEIAGNKQFLLFSQCFLRYMALILHFNCTLKCRLQFVSTCTSLKLCRLLLGYPVSVDRNILSYGCMESWFVRPHIPLPD